MTSRVLAGPPLAAGPESLADHQHRLGPRPPAAGVIGVLGASGLLGRGGAGFPVARKWATVAERGDGRAVVLANGAEGEPLSSKDRAIMAARPHLVLDGAELAAEAVGADRIILYVGGEHAAALAALERASAERAVSRDRRGAVPIELVAAPHSYIAGEDRPLSTTSTRAMRGPRRRRRARSSEASAGGRRSSRTSSRSPTSRSSPGTATPGIASWAPARRVAARS